MTEILQKNVPEKEWNFFLGDCPISTVYHTPGWKKFLEETFSYESCYIFAVNECREIVGFLPLFQVNSMLSGNRLSSIPFAHECNPLGSTDVVMDLIAAAIDLNKHLDVGYIELRAGTNHPAFTSQNLFSTYTLQLSTVEKTWGLIHKSAKRYIKKSMENLSVTRSNFKEDAEMFYQINCTNKKNKGVPSHPEKFFKNLIRIFQDSAHIYLAKLGQETIGGVITIDSGTDTVIYGYGASDPSYLSYNPLYACLWKSIEDACHRGRTCYDFGRVSYDNLGLVEFKKKWGTCEKKLCYSYFPAYRQSLSNSRDSTTHRLAAATIQRMPMPMYRAFSNKTFGHFG
jgi:hypothetical protein